MMVLTFEIHIYIIGKIVKFATIMLKNHKVYYCIYDYYFMQEQACLKSPGAHRYEVIKYCNILYNSITILFFTEFKY